jgi:hypothetical protein
MAIKRKEEMFGDGAGFGPAVPYSTSNPSGTASGNRGVGFGEQVTAAVSNRTPYALCLNDEDLEDRLLEFETSGLDAAYRLGLTPTPGGGRVITVDDDAVETVSSFSSNRQHGISNASLRIDSSGDTVNSGIGIEVIGQDSSAARNSRGILYRAECDFGAAANTDVTAGGTPGVANPGGAGSNVINTTGQVASAGPITDLRVGVDFVLITGGPANYNGLYELAGVSGTNQILIRELDGSSGPTGVVADTAVTVQFFRSPFAAMAGTPVAPAFNSGVRMAGFPNASAALSIVAGGWALPTPASGSPSFSDSGASFALAVLAGGSIGTDPVRTAGVDAAGRFWHSDNGGLPGTTLEKQLNLVGLPALYSGRFGGHASDALIGHLHDSQPTTAQGFDASTVSLHRNRWAGGTTLPFSFINATRISVDVSGLGPNEDPTVRIPISGLLIRIDAPSVDAGFYRVTGKFSYIANGSSVLDLEGIGGQTVTLSGAGGTCTVYRMSMIGGVYSNTFSPDVAIGNSTLNAAAILTGSELAEQATTLVLNANNQAGSTFIRGFQAGYAGIGDGDNETFVVEADGDVLIEGSTGTGPRARSRRTCR